MPTTKSPVHATDLDYDTAMLSTPLDGDQLDALSSIITARDLLAELTNTVQTMQRALEAGAAPYPLREQHAIDIEQLSDRLVLALTGILD